MKQCRVITFLCCRYIFQTSFVQVVCALPSGIGGSIVDITGHHMSRMQAGWLIDETVNGFTYTLQVLINIYGNCFFFFLSNSNCNQYLRNEPRIFAWKIEIRSRLYFLTLSSLRKCLKRTTSEFIFFTASIVKSQSGIFGFFRYSYQAVKRWCKNAPESNIFLLDKIIIPVNINNSHWCCFVAYMQRRHLQYYDSRDTGGQQHGTLEEGYKHINGFKVK